MAVSKSERRSTFRSADRSFRAVRRRFPLMEARDVRSGQFRHDSAEPANSAVRYRVRQLAGGRQSGRAARGADRRHAQLATGRSGLRRHAAAGGFPVRCFVDAGADDDAVSAERSVRRGVVPADPRSWRWRGGNGRGDHHRHGDSGRHDRALRRRSGSAGGGGGGCHSDRGGDRARAGGQRGAQSGDGRGVLAWRGHAHIGRAQFGDGGAGRAVELLRRAGERVLAGGLQRIDRRGHWRHRCAGSVRRRGGARGDRLRLHHQRLHRRDFVRRPCRR